MRFRLWVTFLEVPAGHACHEVALDARHFRIAVNRGLMRILDNPHLKRRRIRSGIICFTRLDTNDNARSNAKDSALSNTNGNGNGGSK